MNRVRIRVRFEVNKTREITEEVKHKKTLKQEWNDMQDKGNDGYQGAVPQLTAKQLFVNPGIAGDWHASAEKTWDPCCPNVIRCAINSLVALSLITAGFGDIVITEIAEYAFPEGIDKRFIIIARSLFQKNTEKLRGAIHNTMTSAVVSSIARNVEYADRNCSLYKISGGTVMVALFGKKILSLIKDPETLAKVQSEIAPPVPTITIKDLDDLEKNIKALPEPPNKRLQMHHDIFNMKFALLRDIEMCYDECLHVKVKQFADTMERWIKSDWYLESRYMIDFARYKRNLVKYRAYDVSKWNIKELMFKARPRLDEYIVYIDLNKGMWQSSQIVGALLEEYRCPIISKIVSNR